MNEIGIIGVPSSAGAYAPGQEAAPDALREEGLIELLEQLEFPVTDHGNCSRIRWTPDRNNRLAQNVNEVIKTITESSSHVQSIVENEQLAVVIGGDCTVGLGTIAGVRSTTDDIGVIYFDLHPDMNTPSSTTDGALDWMGMAHALGLGGSIDQITQSFPERPLLSHDEVYFFSYGPSNATDWEREIMRRFGIPNLPVDQVAASPIHSAKSTLESFANDFGSLVVHFDVDTIDYIDTPLAESTNRNEGLALEVAMQAFEVLLQAPNLTAITITEINPYHGAEDGSTIRRFVDRLAAAFAATEGDE